MDFLNKYSLLVISFLSLSLSGCQVGYLLQSAGGELDILSHRIPIEQALQDPHIPEEDKRKLRLTQETRQFAQSDLGLKSNKNYTSYVDLHRPYVTYVVSASEPWKLKNYLWSFPITGDVPYKGYFNEKDALEEEQQLKNKKLDTYVRGVSAFSTLGWFHDPVLSSMLRYSDHDLVNTIIHESVHATLYISSSPDFNERLAVFVANIGTARFYHQREGKDSPTLQKIENENKDEKLFSAFISSELRRLEDWYENNKVQNEDLRQQQFSTIQKNFQDHLLPQLKTDNYRNFTHIKLNNARLLLYKTYEGDLSDFDQLYELSRHDLAVFLEKCKSLQDQKQPEKALHEMILKMSAG